MAFVLGKDDLKSVCGGAPSDLPTNNSLGRKSWGVAIVDINPDGSPRDNAIICAYKGNSVNTGFLAATVSTQATAAFGRIYAAQSGGGGGINPTGYDASGCPVYDL